MFTSSSEKKEQFNNKKWLPYDLEDYGVGSVDEVYEDAKVYYEYVQFKRAKFKCTGTEYDRNSGRIINMKFECTWMGVYYGECIKSVIDGSWSINSNSNNFISSIFIF